MADGDILRLADLPRDRPHPVALAPGTDVLGPMAGRLGVDALRKVRLEGRLHPEAGGWRLDARLGATIVQPCGVTLEPVTTRVDEPVARRWSRDWREPEGEEAEAPAEDVEPLPATLDLLALVEEAVALSVPPFPRAPGAEPLDVAAGPPGAEPLTDEAAKPFAGLAGLKARMEGGEGGGD